MKILPKPLSPIYNMSRYQSELRQMMIINKYPPPTNGRVLDLCCGSGQYRAYFTDQEYIGVDKFDNNFSAKESKNVKYFVEDAEKLSFEDEYFDYVFFSAGLEHVRDKEKATDEMVRVMKKGAYAYVAVPTKVSKIYGLPRYIYYKLRGEKYYGHGHHYFSKSDLKALMLDHGLEIKKFYPETGFFALIWITVSKWFYTIKSIFYAIFKKIIGVKQIQANISGKNKISENINNNSDPRDDHGIKVDFYLGNYIFQDNDKSYYHEYGVIRKMLVKVIFIVDYLLPIPIVAGWIVIVRKTR